MPRLPSPEDLGGVLAPRPARGVTEIRPAPLDRGTEFLTALGNLAEQETERLEGIAAENALNKLRERRVDLTMAEGKGFQHVRGGAVIERPVLKEFPDAFNREIEQISMGLNTRRARERFQQKAQAEALGFRTDLMRHVAAQSEAFADATFKATVQVEAGVAGAMYSDPIAVDAALQRVEERAADEAVRLGMTDPKLRELFTQQTSGAVVTAAIQGALGNNDSPTAMALLEQYGDKLSEQQRRGLDTAVQSANAWDVGQSLAEEAFSMTQAGVSATKVEQYLIDKTRGNKAAYGNAQTVLGQLMGARQEQRREASESAQDEINRGANWGAIRHKYLGSMSPEAVAAFDSRAATAAKGRKTEPNFALYFELSQRIAQGDTGVILPEYVDQLSESELSKLDTQLRAAQTDKGARDLRTLDQQFAAAEMQMSRTAEKPMLIREKGLFRDWVTTEIELEMERKGRELDYQERQAIIRRGMLVVEEGGWFSSDVRGYHQPRLTPRPAQAAPTAAPSVIVPGDDRAMIIQGYIQNQGRRPTEAEIQETYRAVQGAQ